MRNSLLIVISFFIINRLKAQAPACASVCDTHFNNNHTPPHYFSSPMPVPFNTNINGRIDVINDRDYYKYTVINRGTITLALCKFSADYNLRLVNRLAYNIGISVCKGNAGESISYKAISNTVYFALVCPVNRRTFNSNACHTLKIITRTSSRALHVLSEEAALYPNPIVDFVSLQLIAVKDVLQIRLIKSNGSNSSLSEYSTS